MLIFFHDLRYAVRQLRKNVPARQPHRDDVVRWRRWLQNLARTANALCALSSFVAHEEMLPKDDFLVPNANRLPPC